MFQWNDVLIGLSCLQVFLGPNGEVEEYAVATIQLNAAISSDLILDHNEEHLFIMTPNMVCCSPCLNIVLLGNVVSTYIIMIVLVPASEEAGG